MLGSSKSFNNALILIKFVLSIKIKFGLLFKVDLLIFLIRSLILSIFIVFEFEAISLSKKNRFILFFINLNDLFNYLFLNYLNMNTISDSIVLLSDKPKVH